MLSSNKAVINELARFVHDALKQKVVLSLDKYWYVIAQPRTLKSYKVFLLFVFMHCINPTRLCMPHCILDYAHWLLLLTNSLYILETLIHCKYPQIDLFFTETLYPRGNIFIYSRPTVYRPITAT